MVICEHFLLEHHLYSVHYAMLIGLVTIYVTSRYCFFILFHFLFIIFFKFNLIQFCLIFVFSILFLAVPSSPFIFATIFTIRLYIVGVAGWQVAWLCSSVHCSKLSMCISFFLPQHTLEQGFLFPNFFQVNSTFLSLLFSLVVLRLLIFYDDKTVSLTEVIIDVLIPHYQTRTRLILIMYAI